MRPYVIDEPTATSSKPWAVHDVMCYFGEHRLVTAVDPDTGLPSKAIGTDGVERQQYWDARYTHYSQVKRGNLGNVLDVFAEDLLECGGLWADVVRLYEMIASDHESAAQRTKCLAKAAARYHAARQTFEAVKKLRVLALERDSKSEASNG
jgi:hypothetical protein